MFDRSTSPAWPKKNDWGTDLRESNGQSRDAWNETSKDGKDTYYDSWGGNQDRPPCFRQLYCVVIRTYLIVFNCNTRMLWVIFLLSKLIFYSQPLLEVTQNRVVGVEGKMSSHAMIHLERYPVTPVQEEMSHPWIGSMNAVEDIL